MMTSAPLFEEQV